MNEHVHIYISIDTKKIRGLIVAQEILIANNVSFTQDDKELSRSIFSKVNELVYLINLKDTGIYDIDEVFTSEQSYIYSTDALYKQIYRTTVLTGALPNAGTVNIPHNIPWTADWDFITMDGMAKDPVGLTAIGMDHPAITIVIGAVNLTITTTANLSAYTSSHVILRYTKD